MSSATKNEEVTKLIMNFLEQHPDKMFTQEDIIAALLPKLDVKGDYHIKYPLQCMVINGVAHGRIDKSRVVRVSYKNPNEQKGSDGTELVPKTELEKLSTAFRNEKSLLIKSHEDVCNSFHARISELLEQKSKERIVKVVVEQGKKKAREISETFHTVFEEVVCLANARENIFLYGPTGSGKTYIGAQLAKVLDLPFYFVSGSRGMSESKLTGRVLPTGKNGSWEYSPSEFVKAYENGGVYLLDEIDALDDNVLLILNTALSNDQFAVPERKGKEYVTRHPDFICIAAANTLGMGADRQYSSRNKLDAATMDRFAIGKLLVDYDPQLEEQICPDEELRNRLVSFRKAIDTNRLERAMSTRFLEKAYKMKQRGWTQERIEKAYFTGWREDEKNKVLTMVGSLNKPNIQTSGFEFNLKGISGGRIEVPRSGGMNPKLEPMEYRHEPEPTPPSPEDQLSYLKKAYESDGEITAVRAYRNSTSPTPGLKEAVDHIKDLAKTHGWKKA